MVNRAMAKAPGARIGAIKTPTGHRAALKEIERLMDAKPKPNTSAGQRLEALVRLVDAYESRIYPIKPPTRAAALQYEAESHRPGGRMAARNRQRERAAPAKSRHRAKSTRSTRAQRPPKGTD
jgi:hypothetical protein